MKKLLVGVVASTSLVAAPLLAFAEDDVSTDASVNVSADVTTSGRLHAGDRASAGDRAEVRARVSANGTEEAKNRADQEIDRRINRLQDFEDHLQNMKRVSDDGKSSLDASIAAQIQALTNLKTKIANDDSTTTLRADIKSITESYRIYALVMPQSAITAAAKRVQGIVANMQTLAGKFDTRISEASSVSAEVTAALADYKAKIADANTQAQAAIDGVAALKPDNGDQATQQANLAALKAARTKLQAAQQDIVAARKDAHTIVTGLKGTGKVSASAEASTTAE